MQVSWATVSWATTTLKPVLQSLGTTITESAHPRAPALQQEKPPQQEAHTPQPESSPGSLQLEKSQYTNKDPVLPKLTKKKKKGLGLRDRETNTWQDQWSGGRLQKQQSATGVVKTRG